MYAEYFDLKEPPFSIAPDPRYLYLSEQHREALAHLLYGINSDGGFVLLTGEVGTGKTTVCRCLLGQIPENTDIAFVLNPKLTPEELLATICDELGIRYPEGNTSSKVFVDLINTYLLDAYARGRRTVLVIEEAQNLSAEVLEQIRLLTNLETNQHKLLQIIMLGQPELNNKLSQPELQQLEQRITARYHLHSLSKKEVAAYVNHRLSVAGARNQLFPDSTSGELFHLSRGIPRLINVLCDRALLGAYVQGRSRVDKKTLAKAAREIFGHKVQGHTKGTFKWVLASALFIGLIAVSAAIYYNYHTQLLAIVTTRYIHQKSTSKLKTESPILSLLNWPADQPIHRSKELAYQSLLKQWNIIYKPSNGYACKQSQAHGLDCLYEHGDLSSLIHLNRPAVVKLHDDQGREFYAALTALQGQNAAIIIGTEIKMVDLKEVEQRWSGNYTILWRMPPDYKVPVLPGQKGKVVQWLDKQMSLMQDRPTRLKKKLVFDSTLIREVQKFQLAKGLIPNGIVGPHTIIHLNTEVGSDEPLLISKKANK